MPVALNPALKFQTLALGARCVCALARAGLGEWGETDGLLKRTRMTQVTYIRVEFCATARPVVGVSDWRVVPTLAPFSGSLYYW